MIHLKTNLKSSSSLIDLTPLVDVVFLMLIFFLITSDILPLKSLEVKTPSLPLDATALTTQIYIVVDKTNVIYAGSKKTILSLPEIKEYLLDEVQKIMKHGENTKPSIVLSLDEQVEYGLFLRLFSLVQETHLPIRLCFQPEESFHA